jgi:hypothetical protein
MFGVALAAIGFVIVVARMERMRQSAFAADRALTGAAFGIALPLAVYFVVEQLTAGAALRDVVTRVSRHGASRRGLLLGLFACAGALCAMIGAGLAVAAVLGARAWSDPALMRDLVASVGIGVAASTSYAALLGVGATLGSRGQGRFWLLACDWVFGAGNQAFAAPWPRGHVRNLLGAEAVLDLPQWGGLCVLLALIGVCTGLALWRTPT